MQIDHVVLGTGAIGRAVAEELTQRGESVRLVNRSGKMDEAPAGVEWSLQIFMIGPRSRK